LNVTACYRGRPSIGQSLQLCRQGHELRGRCCWPFIDEAQAALFKDPVRTAQFPLFISVIKTNQFMLYRENVAVCSQINIKHTNTVWQSVTFKNCTLCSYSIYMFCIDLRTNTDFCPIKNKLIGFITEIESVYSAVRTGSLNEPVCACSTYSIN
jgi:hypothetical protein